MKCINVLLSHIIVISILILFEEVYAYMRMVNKIIKNIYDIVENSDPYELMDKSEIISFDIYDTLLQRDVAKPTDLFVFLEKELVKQNYAAYGFAECRIKAEKLAAKKYGEFTTLENIYDEISNINPEFSKFALNLSDTSTKSLYVVISISFKGFSEYSTGNFFANIPSL